MVDSFAQTHGGEAFQAVGPASPPANHSGKHNVFKGSQFGEEKVALKDEAHLLVSQFREGRFPGSIKLRAFKLYLPGFGSLKPRERVKQCRFTRPRGATKKNAF